MPQFASPPSPDVAWLLYSAGRLLDGARLNVDIVEINPPLIVWLNVPPVWLARLLDVSEVQVFRTLLVIAAIASAAASDMLLERADPERSVSERRLLVLLLTFALLALPGADFGEREHLLLIAALPYILMAAVRRRGGRVAPAAALLAGTTAGVGIALKPYFLVLPLAVEAWLWARRARRLRPEVVGIVLALTGYLATVVIWGREYLSLARAFGTDYFGYLRDPPLLTAVAGDGVGIPLLAFLAASALPRRLRDHRLGGLFLVSTVALYLSAVLQQKGWRYHFYPSMATGLVLLALLARAAGGELLSMVGRVYAAAIVATLGFVPVTILAAGMVQLLRPRYQRYTADPDLGALVELTRREAPGGAVWVLSPNPASAFPLVYESRVRWASRFPCLWLLVAAYRDELAKEAPLAYRDTSDQTSAERYLVKAVVDDLRRWDPKLILALQPAPDQREWGTRRLDFVKYFSRDTAFARAFSRYSFLGTIGEYQAFRRAEGAPVASAPRTPEPALPPPNTLGVGVQIAPPGTAALLEATFYLVLFAVGFRRVLRSRR